MCIGYLHSLFYRGDILTIYAILGVFLIPFYRLSNTVVLSFAALLFLGMGRYIIFFVTQGDSLWEGEIMTTNSAKVSSYYTTLQRGTILDVFEANAIEGHKDKLDFQFNVFGRGYFTFAFFLLGLYIGRSGFFRKYREDRSYTRRILIWSSVVLVITLILSAVAFLSLGENVTFDNWTAMLGLTMMDLANMALTVIYIALFVILYRRSKPEKWLSKFAPYGRMALTNYFFQSLIGTFLLFGWGLGYIGELRQLYTLVIALLIIIGQVLLSDLWLRYFNYGPLEWLWRSLTFFKAFPLIKKRPYER